jgi:hypothetical protein
MSPRAVDKRARPGNERNLVRPARPTAPETPSAVTVLEAAEHTLNRISQPNQAAKAS